MTQINNKGQSTIEFLVTFAVVFGLMFSFVRIAITFTNGYLVHYATFMASRVYLSADNNSNQTESVLNYARKKSETEYKSLKTNVFLGNVEEKFSIMPPQTGTQGLYTGAKVDFKQPFITMPILSFTKKLDLTSESFLGREPSRVLCHEMICHAFELEGANCNTLVTLYDNGC